MKAILTKLKRIWNHNKIQVVMVGPRSDDHSYTSYNKNTHTFDGEKLPDCIDDQGHYFKTCDRCSHMVCRRCNTTSYDFWLSLCSSYGDFGGSYAEYDRYCSKCGRLVQRGHAVKYSHSFKCYEDWEQHRIANDDTVCRVCHGKGHFVTHHDQQHRCSSCEGTGKFPSPSRIKSLEKIKKEKSEYPKMMTSWDLFLELFKW
jgi:ribosomal protein L37E